MYQSESQDRELAEVGLADGGRTANQDPKAERLIESNYLSFAGDEKYDEISFWYCAKDIGFCFSVVGFTMGIFLHNYWMSILNPML